MRYPENRKKNSQAFPDGEGSTALPIAFIRQLFDGGLLRPVGVVGQKVEDDH